MGTLYIDRKDIDIRAQAGALVLHADGGRCGSAPLALLDRVVIRSRATLDTKALGAMAEYGIGLVILNGRHASRTAILHGRAQNDVARRVAQYQWYLDADKREQFSRTLVLGKVRAQHRLLARAMETRPDIRKPLFDGVTSLAQMQSRLEASENDRISLASLRGIEGAAAAAYFGAFTSLFAPELEFHGRNRRPPRDSVNACLSLAYTLAHAEAVLACHGAGLDPLLGLFHEPVFGRDSLAADFVEPLRPRVDYWVWELFHSRTLRRDNFAIDKGACLLGKAGRASFYAAWELEAHSMRRWLRLHVGRFARLLAQTVPPTLEAFDVVAEEA